LALPASDNFNRASLGSNWTTITGSNDIGISSNAAVGTVNGQTSSAYWNADTFAADQYCEVTLSLFPNITWMGPMVRMSTSANNGYSAQAERSGSTTLKLYRTDAGSTTQIGSTYTGSVVQGDVIRIEVEGDTITLKQNGTTRVTATDSTYTTGQAGLWIFTNSTARTLDDWTAGNIGGTVVGQSGYLGDLKLGHSGLGTRGLS
jgi:hypothetical protein